MKITREIDRKMDLRLSSLLALQDLEKMATLRHHFGTFLAWVPIFVWKNNEKKNVIIFEIVAKRDILWWKEFGLGVEACTSTMNWKFHHKFRRLRRLFIFHVFGTDFFFLLESCKIFQKETKLQWKLKDRTKNHAKFL